MIGPWKTEAIRPGDRVRYLTSRRTKSGHYQRFERVFAVQEVIRLSYETGYVTVYGFDVNVRTGVAFSRGNGGGRVIGISEDWYLGSEAVE